MGCKLPVLILVLALTAACSSSAGSNSEERSTAESTANNTEQPAQYLDPKDFLRGSLIRVTDVSSVGVDPIPTSGRFEGDIDLRGLPYEAYVDRVIDDSPYKTDKEIAYSAIRDKWFHWPNAEIPYEIELEKFSRYDRAVIASALADHEKHTCIRWIPRQPHNRDYVRIVSDVGCYSSIGKVGGRQDIPLGRGCLSKGIVLHEMMHAIGFFHEQARADRDDYVTIKWDNVKPLARGNFKKMTLEKIDQLGSEYDYGSVMHYGKNYFSKNGNDTIIVKKSNIRIGQRRGFSSVDIKKINKLYNCPQMKPATTTPRPIAPSQLCIDRNELCEWWASNNQCVESRRPMMKLCKRSCGFCNADNDQCYDKKIYCEHWKNEGYCLGEYVTYMKINCKKSCGVC